MQGAYNAEPMSLPRVTRVYQNHHLDSTRWERYQPRPGDIIVTTSYKAGTTFAQHMLLHLLYGKRDPVPQLSEVSPWIDARFMPGPLDAIYAGLEKMRARRFLKSHLPLDGLPYFAEVKYLIVARDPRDVFMSFANHYENYTELAYQAMNGGERVGDPLPPFPDDLHGLWRDWMTRGWFEWESEGYPFWGNLGHTQSYWDHRHLPNFLLLHYADLLADHEASVRKIASFIEHPVSDDDVARVVEATTFANVRKKALEVEANAPSDQPRVFRGGQAAFFFKGTNGRWKDVLTADDLALYEDAKSRVLSADCAKWLETGGEVPS